MADEGLRVLGIAKAKFNFVTLPEFSTIFEFEFKGLLGWKTYPRTGSSCDKRMLRRKNTVIMITGDYPGTAQNNQQADWP